VVKVCILMAVPGGYVGVIDYISSDLLLKDNRRVSIGLYMLTAVCSGPAPHSPFDTMLLPVQLYAISSVCYAVC